MKVFLDKKPKNVKIIAGFPGVGLVGTITTEFLIEHLNAEQIGKIKIEETPPIVAVHQGKVVEPIGIFYNKKHNLIILHALTSINNIEWQLADEICYIMKELKAKEVISIEGIGSTNTENPNVYFLSNLSSVSKKLDLENLKEGIVMGVTGALLLKSCLILTCLFAETHSNLPDSRAAANIIKTLDKYLGLKIDYKPLLAKAVKFENKIKELMNQRELASSAKEKKELTY